MFARALICRKYRHGVSALGTKDLHFNTKGGSTRSTLLSAVDRVHDISRLQTSILNMKRCVSLYHFGMSWYTLRCHTSRLQTTAAITKLKYESLNGRIQDPILYHGTTKNSITRQKLLGTPREMQTPIYTDTRVRHHSSRETKIHEVSDAKISGKPH